MTTAVVLPRRHLAAALATATSGRSQATEPALEIVTAASLVAIVIVRRPGDVKRATLWATSESAAVTTLVTGDRFEIRSLERRLLVLEACRLTGVGRRRPPPARPGTEHRSSLERWRFDGRPISTRWELSVVNRRTGPVAHASLEAIDVSGAGSYEVRGDTWVTFSPISGDEARHRIAAAFAD